MKRIFLFAVVLAIGLTGCTEAEAGLGRVLQFRQEMMKANGCKFQANIKADYGEDIYEFAMQCQTGEDQVMAFEICEPETIKGICGTFGTAGGKLVFEDAALAFPTLADGLITPVSAPWIFVQTLLGGYIDTVGEEEDQLRATVFENYEENALQLDIWFDSENRPVYYEILWQNRSVLSVSVESFEFL